MRAAIITMGCKVNQAESASMIALLSAAGYEIGEAKGADLIVLNTCSVTSKADKEALSRLRRLRRDNPRAYVVASGCLAELNPEKLVGPNLANLALDASNRTNLLENLPNLPGKPTKNIAFSAVPAPYRTRVFLKIQDGCSSNCAYCVVPLARGPSRSIDPLVAKDQLQEILAQGVREVVLTGIHLGHYGLDIGTNLMELLALIEKEVKPTSPYRLRLSSLEPNETSLAIKALTSGLLAPHLHAPLQSGSDRILKLMGRPYLREDYRRVILDLAAKFGPMALGCDVLVGFPKESEQDFQQTYALLEELPLSYFHVFPYSPRPGTKAALLPDQIPTEVKKDRVKALKDLDRLKRLQFLETQYPLKHLALVENTIDRNGQFRVLTGSYLRAVWAHDSHPKANSLIEVRLSPPKTHSDPPEARPW
jgi:threonylcarbamoyladenosine tRNA methylthiotransferase MtaB